MSEEAASIMIAKMLPTGSIAVASVMGLPLQEWTYIVAILVGITQVVYTGYCTYRKWKDKPTQDSDED